MKKSWWLNTGLLCALVSGVVSAVAAPDMPRERVSFNADWRFQKGDPANIQAVTL